MKVAVVGAGAAGLAATHTLRKAGVDVTLFESTPYAGGRTRCYTKEGFILDVGAQFTGAVCNTQLGYAREFGFIDEVVKFPMEAGFWRDGKIYALPPSNLRGFIRHFDRLLKFRGIPLKANLQMAKVFFQMFRRMINIDAATMNPDGLIDLGDTSVAEFTLKHGGKEALEWGMRPATGAMTIGEAEDVAITHLIALMGLYKGIYLMKRGMGSIVEALYQANKNHVKLSTPVTEIVIENGQVKGVAISQGFMPADHVICATTATMALKLMPNLPKSIGRALAKVRYSSTVHVMVGMPERILPGNMYAMTIPSAAKSFLIALNDGSGKSEQMAPPGTGLGHLCTFGTRAPELMDMPDDEVVERVIKEAVRLGGNFRTKPIVADVVRWKEAICLEAPGQFPEMYCMRRTAKDDVRGLHLAGEYNYLVSCVEGAMRSGVDASKEIIAQRP